MPFENTVASPESGRAYHFHYPTGRLIPEGGPEYSPWTQGAMVFDGNWEEAIEYGVLRSKEYEPVESSSWPEGRTFRFPEGAISWAEKQQDQKALTIMREFLRNMGMMREAAQITPGVGTMQAIVKASQGVEESLG